MLVPSADYADPMGASALRRFISGGCGCGCGCGWNLEKQVKTADQSKSKRSCRPKLQVTNDLLKGVGCFFPERGCVSVDG